VQAVDFRAGQNFGDAQDEKPGLPKALSPVRKYFDYLVRKQYKYGYAVFFNINICRNNMDDVKQLTEIAREHGIATDYHLNESPMIEQVTSSTTTPMTHSFTRRTGREWTNWLIG
jgi:hypothetical protein